MSAARRRSRRLPTARKRSRRSTRSWAGQRLCRRGEARSVRAGGNRFRCGAVRDSRRRRWGQRSRLDRGRSLEPGRARYVVAIILITDDAAFADKVAEAVARALATLPRRDIAGASWREHGAIIVVKRLDRSGARWSTGSRRSISSSPSPIRRRCSPRAPCRRDLPRPLHAGSDGRLHRRPQPRAADGAHGALFVRAFRARFPEAHDDSFLHAEDDRRLGPDAIALAEPKDSTRTPARSPPV